MEKTEIELKKLFAIAIVWGVPGSGKYKMINFNESLKNISVLKLNILAMVVLNKCRKEGGVILNNNFHIKNSNVVFTQNCGE